MLIWNDGRGHKLTDATYLCLTKFGTQTYRKADSGCDAHRRSSKPTDASAGTETNDLAVDDVRRQRCVVYSRHDDDDDVEMEEVGSDLVSTLICSSKSVGDAF